MDCQPTHTSPHVVSWETLDDITSPSPGLPDDNFFRWSDALLLSSWLEFGLLGKKHLDPNYVVFIILGSLNCIYPSDGAFMPLKREVESTKLDFRGLSMWQQQFNLGLIELSLACWHSTELGPLFAGCHLILHSWNMLFLVFCSLVTWLAWFISWVEPSRAHFSPDDGVNHQQVRLWEECVFTAVIAGLCLSGSVPYRFQPEACLPPAVKPQYLALLQRLSLAVLFRLLTLLLR